MVFESVVSDLLNRFIGDYVENLDKSQLKIGIWGGNVVLENLKVKENALSEFNVPFKVKAGQIGKLTIKIPWKNLYNDAVVATLDGFYLLVVPGATGCQCTSCPYNEIKFDADKEERHLQELKQKDLQRIEDALSKVPTGHKKVRKHRKGLRRSKGHRADVPQQEKKDTFVEKLATQVIKNLQVKISSIHLRYEDDVSEPTRPLSMGVTLSELSLQTTDENWKSCILNQAAKIIYKLARLDCLCAYWNVNSSLFYGGSWQEIIEQLKCGISSREQQVSSYQYIFRPIFASAKICINPTAELEMTGPKMDLHLEVQEIGVEMTKAQYLTMVELLESIDYMVKNAPYRRFRPEVQVHHSPKLWWRYSFNSIMEVHVRRLRRMWSWSNIRQHRNNLRSYKNAYKSKLLSQSKAGSDAERQIQELEKVLDVFNITLARQQAQMEMVHSGHKVGKNLQKQGGGGGFFSSWFGRKAKKEEQEQPTGSEIDTLLTAEEKEKLYVAIGYSGSSHNLTLPRQYVAVVVSFKLLKTSVTLRERPDVPEILQVQIINLCTKVSQRPGAQAIRVEAELRHWFVTGLQQNGLVPSLISSVGDSSSSLLSVNFEMNPENSVSDQLLHVSSQPVEIIYDAGTVNRVVDFFRTEKGVDLEVLTSATLSKLEEIKEKTTTGLSHIIETRKVLDLRIDLKPSYLVLPKSGFYNPASEVLIVDFGNFQLHSVEQSSLGSSSSSSSSFSSLEEIMERAYERFNLELRRVQVLYCKSGESWKSARLQSSSVQHVLRPLDITVQLAKCMVEKDARMARFKVCGELPLLHVRVSDQKIHNMVELVQSVPLPWTSSSPSVADKELPKVKVRPAAPTLPPVLLQSPETDSDSTERSTDEENQRSALEELIDLHFKFEVKEVLLELTRQEVQEVQEVQEQSVLTFSVCQLGAEGKQRTFDLSLNTYLRRVCLDYCDLPGGPLHLVSSSDQQHSDLLKVDYIKADPAGPSFHSQFCSTEQTLKVEMSSLDFLLHTKALLSTITYLNRMFPTELSSKQSRKKPSSSSAAVSPGGKEGGVFSLKVLARLLCVHVEVCDDHQTIADIQVQGIDAAVSVQAAQTEVFARLRDIVVTDANPRTVHRKVVSIVGDEVFSFTLRLFSGATDGDAYSDVSNVDGTVTLRLGCIQIIYLHQFYMSLLASCSAHCGCVDEMFVDHFQEAKDALSSATAQAAEKAASSVMDFAQKSSRVSLDVSLKAPLIIIPQSSTSHNALLMDLGLITVGNSFSLQPVEGFPLPAVMEAMKIHLTQLKVCRTKLGPDVSQMDCDVLQPIDLELLVSRNLSSSWFSRIPAVQIQGVLRSLHVSLSEEDLSVVMKILAENIGEGSKAERVEVSRKKLTDEAEAADPEVKTPQCENGAGEPSENITKLLLDFHIKEVLLTLRRTSPFLVLRVSQLGINTKVRRLDTCGSTYIRQITVECPGFKDCRGAPVCLVSSLVEPGSELLKVQYLKAHRSAPNFSSFYKNTEQMINVTFSSLDLTLHTEALLSTLSFLSTALSSGSVSSSDTGPRPRVDHLGQSISSTSSPSPEDSHVIDLKVMMTLGAFNVLLCDQSCDITNIKIKGLHGSLLVQGSQTHVSTRLQDFLVLNVDPETVHKKAISILGEEVFSFSLSLTPSATEGSGYSDVSRTDGTVKLTVGCVRVVYLHRFIMTLLNFSNSFQEAKEALSVATAQAAEKAASSVRDFAKKTFRLSVDVRLKAPIIVVPQSSRSHEALLVDLGLITAGNSFSLTTVEGRPLPAVIDHMEVELTELKLSRISTETSPEQSSTELLEPVNLHLDVRRNLSASWYKEIPAVDLEGDLKPMKLQLSQDDLKVLLRILFENLSEAQVIDGPQEAAQQLHRPVAPPTNSGRLQWSSISEDEKEEETMKFNFNIKSLGLVLYGSDSSLPVQLQHQQDLRLGELVLHLLSFSGTMHSSGGVEVSAVLTALTLDDLRSGVERASSRMVGRREQEGSEPMMDVTFRQRPGRREVVTVLQKIYLCASVEFLLAVGEFFLQALPQSSASNASSAAGDRTLAKQNTEPRAGPQNGSGSGSGSGSMLSSFRAVVVDPEVLFVASLRSADAPALAASFQCDMTLQMEGGGAMSVRANLRELKVLACPFIRDQENSAVTTVLRPCSIALEAHREAGRPLQGSVTVEEVIVKISPFIINTVTTITAAMMEKHHSVPLKEAEPAVGDLWSVMNIYGCNFWFLGVDPATEVTESFRETDGSNEGENFAVDVKVVQVTLESGLGHRTVPLLLAESSLSGSATDWSSLLQLKALMTLEVNYFNETHAVWEPLIERVDGGQRRWNLQVEMKTNPVHDKSPVPGDDFVVLPEPRSSITICSKDTMNITVSQSCLSVFSNLQKAFSEGSSSTFDPSLKEKAPFTVVNSLGIPLILHHSSNLRPVGCATPGKLHELNVGQSLDLEHSVFEAWTRGCLSALQRQESCLFSLSIVPSGFSEISNIAVDKPGRRLYNIRGPMLQEAVSVLLQIDAADGNKVVTVRSPLQIKNHFSVPFTVLKYCPSSQSLQTIGQAEPETDFHVALETYRSQLFVQPAGVLDGLYGPSVSCVAWKEQVHRSSEVSSLLQCPASESSLLPLMVSTLAVPDNLRHIASHGEDDWDPAYVIHLHPVATLRNFLPYSVRYMMESSADSFELPEGSTSDLLNARVSGEILSLVLVQYQGRDWHGHLRIQAELPEFFAVCLICDSDLNLSVDVSVHVSKVSNRLLLSLFSPYWIINKTSRVLRYRAEDVSVKHPADFRDVILFSFKKKNLFTKSKIQLCVSTSLWSEGFSLDTVGSYGCVRCPANNMDFLVGVSIQMSSFNLSRIVTMSPFYTLVNRTSYELEVGEVQPQTSTRWHYISSTECLPLWPEGNSGKLCVRVVGSDSASKSFFYSRQDNGTLLSLDTCGGILVDVNVSNHSNVISFSDYYEGAAPALLLNHTAWVTLSYTQSGSDVTYELKPGEARRFVWDDPTGERVLHWNYRQHSGDLDLLKDEVGQFPYDAHSHVHWVSFLDGRQRTLLFTEDVGAVTKARQAEELEQFEQEVKVSLQNLGLSLVHNSSRQEVAYVGITSSGVVWEMRPKNRWKPLSQKNINLLEKTFQDQQSGRVQPGFITLDTNLEVNLGGATLMMRRPFSCQLRRNFLPGIQVDFKQSQHQRSLRAQLHWLQVDNQLPGAIFPIVFHPVPPPRSVALDSEPRPFIDMSVITRFNQHSNVTQFKYFMALIQEMAVKVDQGFLGSILGLFSPPDDHQSDGQKSGLIQGDLQKLQAELMEASLTETSGLSFFQHFHISPIKLHLSLSLSSGDRPDVESLQSFNLLLKSIGATLTDVDDLVFKLAYFEVKFQFYRRETLMWAVGRHYSEQFLKQMYVLVLGLDVLGNPFGLIRGLSEGVEAFFYEPFQGAVQGPEEFAEGVVIGVRSLLGHTVGGAAGVVSRITGSVGKGLAAITMDKEYQQKRREEMSRPPKDFGESLAKGGKGLLKGVVGGVTGIVTKPVEGAKKEGAAGFFKGIGKGLVGVVARPTGGIIDMASSTFQGIQRAAESTEEVSRLRPVRLIKEDGIIRPYDLHQSQGFDLFQRSEVKQLEGEVFRDHCVYPKHRKTTILVTNKRVLCVKEIDFVNHFNKEWECLFENFYRPPAVNGAELKIYCTEPQKLMIPKKGQEPVRTLQLRDAHAAQKLQAAILDAQLAQQQRRMARKKSQRFLKPIG